MTTVKTINAEDLKLGDIIITPASSQTSKKQTRVINVPLLKDLTVVGTGVRVSKGVSIGHSKPFEYGRKVSIDIIPYDI